MPAWSAEPLELPQADDSTLKLETEAKRLITLSPSLAELVFKAGAGNHLLATVEYSDFPDEVQNLPRVGDAFRIDVERIHQLQPDLVLAWQSGNPEPALAQLETLGFKVWRIEILEPEQISEVIRLIGRAASTEAVAEPTAEDIDNKIKSLKEQYRDAEIITYFYQVAREPLYTVNGDHLISRGFSMCGGKNIFADLPVLAPQVGFESVLLADPEVIIGPKITSQSDPFEQWRSWSRLSAVEKNQFFVLPSDSISRAGPRFIDAIILGCKMMNEYRGSRGS